MHATTAAAERTWSSYGRTFTHKRSGLKLTTAQKLVYIKGNSTSKDSGEPGALVSVAGGEE